MQAPDFDDAILGIGDADDRAGTCAAPDCDDPAVLTYTMLEHSPDGSCSECARKAAIAALESIVNVDVPGPATDALCLVLDALESKHAGQAIVEAGWRVAAQTRELARKAVAK
jgi:hypothetical protein